MPIQSIRRRATTSDGTYNYDWTYSGGGILLGDGGTTTLSQASGFVRAYNNEVVSTQNYAIAIAAGHDNILLQPDDLERPAPRRSNHRRRRTSAPTSGTRTRSRQSLLQQLRPRQSGRLAPGEGVSGDWWVPDATSWTNNNKFSGVITLNTEAAELASWKKKLATNHVTIGPP